jgi:hypothetical protein
MKKLFVLVAVLAGMTLFTSCEDMFDNIIDKLTGNAKAVVGNPDGSESLEQDFTSSIVMFDRDATPEYAVGLSMTMSIENLLEIDDVEDLQFPFLVYRVVGDNIKSGSSFTVENTLTEEDLKDFDYQDLISGEYSENNLVGIAVSPRKFYIMHKGTVTLSKVNNTKIIGSFTGEAYMVDLDADPTLDPELVPMSGDFTSRITEIMKWLINIQEEKGK